MVADNQLRDVLITHSVVVYVQLQSMNVNNRKFEVGKCTAAALGGHLASTMQAVTTPAHKLQSNSLTSNYSNITHQVTSDIIIINLNQHY